MSFCFWSSAHVRLWLTCTHAHTPKIQTYNILEQRVGATDLISLMSIEGMFWTLHHLPDHNKSLCVYFCVSKLRAMQNQSQIPWRCPNKLMVCPDKYTVCVCVCVCYLHTRQTTWPQSLKADTVMSGVKECFYSRHVGKGQVRGCDL